MTRTSVAPALGLGVTRAVFGLVLLVSTLRFVLNGWVDTLYVAPAYHFTYQWAPWALPLPRFGMYALFISMALLASAITLGYRARLSCAAFGLMFTYVELIDKTPYLNHYYLVSIACGLFALVPSGGYELLVLSGKRTGSLVPALSYWAIRAQLGVVYAYAGLAKLNEDWLLRGEPLYTWMQRFSDLPLVGTWIVAPGLALAMSWAGAAFDLGIGPLLLWRRTRVYAYVTACVFHGSIAMLFPVGAFSWVMLALDLAFFSPSWPSALQARLGRAFGVDKRAFTVPNFGFVEARVARWQRVLLGAHFCLQVLLPMRNAAYPGAANWTEEGYRFSWRVMLMEKTGSVRFCVESADGRRAQPLSGVELTPFQRQQMSTQPDMILQFAQHLAAQYRSQGWSGVRVFADSWAALNGRPAQRLVRPDIDLGALPIATPAHRYVVPLSASSAPGLPIAQSQCGIGAERK